MTIWYVCTIQTSLYSTGLNYLFLEQERKEELQRDEVSKTVLELIRMYLFGFSKVLMTQDDSSG